MKINWRVTLGLLLIFGTIMFSFLFNHSINMAALIDTMLIAVAGGIILILIGVRKNGSEED